jgi:hypothetical protein
LWTVSTKSVFLKELIYFGEKIPQPIIMVLNSFIGSYEQLQKTEKALSWEAEIEGSIKYQSDRILNLQIKHYTYTGGAHGYQGLRSCFLPAANPSQTINCLKTGCF